MTHTETHHIEAQTGSDIYAELLNVECWRRQLLLRVSDLEIQVQTLDGLVTAVVDENDALLRLLTAKQAALDSAASSIAELQAVIKGARRC